MKLGFSWVLAVVLLAGCAERPDPEVRTVTVREAVAVPCRPKLPPRPEILTKEQILARLDGIGRLDDRAKLVMDQLLLYMGWGRVLEAGLAGCGQAIDQNSPTTDATTR